MLVDDPVKRVDNMTMAHGLEARTPFLDHELVELAAACPPELKLAEGGKGVLKRAARGVVPDAVIDRPKGYFPVPALSHLEGPVLELVADALRSDAARDARAVPRGRRRGDAARPERAPHEPRRLDALAAGAARAVATVARGLSLTRRQFIARGAALTGAAMLPAVPAYGATNLRKMIDIGPGGVIHPGTAQDYRVYSNRTYFSDTRTGWIRMWADWPSLQPDGRFKIDDPASPGYANLMALDAQIRQACADGLYVLLLPYRHPLWANGTASCRARQRRGDLVHVRRPDVAGGVEQVRANGRNPAVYKPSPAGARVQGPGRGLSRSTARGRSSSTSSCGGTTGGSGRRGATWAGSSSSTSRTCSCGRSGRRPDPGRSVRRHGGAAGRGRQVAQMLATAQAVSARVRHSTGCSRRRPRTPRSSGGWSRTTWSSRPPCWMRAPRSATRRTPRSRGRTTTTPTSRGGWRRACSCCATGCGGAGWGGTEAGAPNVWITEGGARPAKMKTLYPGEDPLAAQAKCLRRRGTCSARRRRRRGRLDDGAVPALRGPELGLRVARGGAVDGQAPGLCDLEGVPEAHVRRSSEEIEAVRRAKARLDRLGVLSVAGADRAGAGAAACRGCSGCRGSGASTATRCGRGDPAAGRCASVSDDLIVHELCHVWQMQHHPIAMPLSYLWRGYANNPNEVEARARQAASSSSSSQMRVEVGGPELGLELLVRGGQDRVALRGVAGGVEERAGAQLRRATRRRAAA